MVLEIVRNLQQKMCSSVLPNTIPLLKEEVRKMREDVIAINKMPLGCTGMRIGEGGECDFNCLRRVDLLKISPRKDFILSGSPSFYSGVCEGKIEAKVCSVLFVLSVLVRLSISHFFIKDKE